MSDADQYSASVSQYIVHHLKDIIAMRNKEIEQLQARNKELEEWVILRCNELGDQIVKRNKTIEQLQAELEVEKDLSVLRYFKIEQLQTRVVELEGELRVVDKTIAILKKMTPQEDKTDE